MLKKVHPVGFNLIVMRPRCFIGELLVVNSHRVFPDHFHAQDSRHIITETATSVVNELPDLWDMTSVHGSVNSDGVTIGHRRICQAFFQLVRQRKLSLIFRDMLADHLVNLGFVRHLR